MAEPPAAPTHQAQRPYPGPQPPAWEKMGGSDHISTAPNLLVDRWSLVVSQSRLPSRCAVFPARTLECSTRRTHDPADGGVDPKTKSKSPRSGASRDHVPPFVSACSWLAPTCLPTFPTPAFAARPLVIRRCLATPSLPDTSTSRPLCAPSSNGCHEGLRGPSPQPVATADFARCSFDSRQGQRKAHHPQVSASPAALSTNPRLSLRPAPPIVCRVSLWRVLVCGPSLQESRTRTLRSCHSATGIFSLTLTFGRRADPPPESIRPSPLSPFASSTPARRPFPEMR